MKRTYSTSFAAALGAHFVLLTTAFLAGYNFIVNIPDKIVEQKLEIGHEVVVLPAEAAPIGTDTENLEATEELPLPSASENPDIPHPEALPEEAIIPDAPGPLRNVIPESSTINTPRPTREKRAGLDGLFGKGNNKVGDVGSDTTPQFFGTPLTGRIVFLLDMSSSMGDKFSTGKTRYKVLMEEIVKAIDGLDAEAEFECVIYNGAYESWNGYCRALWGTLCKASDENKKAAVDWLKDPNVKPQSFTPTYEALRYVCGSYPSDITKMFLVTDGSPSSVYAEQPETIMNRIVLEIPKVWNFADCELICMNIMGGKSELEFLQNLVKSVGGSYINIQD